MQCTCRQGEAPRLLPWYRQRGHPRNFAFAGVCMIVQAFIFLIPMVIARQVLAPMLLGVFGLTLAFAALLFGIAWYKSKYGYRQYHEGYHVPKSRQCDYCQQHEANAVYSL
ncbi:hypothetical protein AAVH_36739 [Aphelenchoides avenae]|nr:hypothetical protein AAVH_36739 [Aphelenchus avenae]